MIMLSQKNNQNVDSLSFRRCKGRKLIYFDREFLKLRLDLSSPEVLGGSSDGKCTLQYGTTCSENLDRKAVNSHYAGKDSSK